MSALELAYAHPVWTTLWLIIVGVTLCSMWPTVNVKWWHK